MLTIIRNQIPRLDTYTVKILIVTSAFVASMLVLVSRIVGLGPRVMGDELTYSTFSRLLPISESPVPNYLYLWLYSSTNLCGPEFYACARIINIGFVFLTAGMVYLIARRMLAFGTSLLIAVAATMGPTSMYAAHFMPDTMFYFATVTFVWLLLKATDSPPTFATYLLLGAAVGVVSLVKPHGLFLLASIPVVAILFISGLREKVKTLIYSGALALASALAIKLGVGFLVAGEKGLALFRSAYGSFVPAIQNSSQNLEAGVWGSLVGVSAQMQNLILASVVLFLVPVAAAFLGLVSSLRGDVSDKKRLAIVLLVLQVVFLLAVATFVSQLEPFDPTQAFRAQLRYFEFLFLLYPISALAYLDTKSKQTSWKVWLILTSVSLLGFLWWIDYVQKFVQVYSDGTFLPMLARFESGGTPIVLVSLLFALLFGIKRDWAIRGWTFVLLPIMVLASIPSMYFDDSIRQNAKPTHVVAAEFTMGTLSSEELSHLVIIGDSRQEIDAARFIISNSNVKRRVTADPSNFEMGSLPSESHWVLVLGSRSLTDFPLLRIEGRGFLLLRLDTGDVSFFDLEEPGRAIIDFLNMEDRGSLGAWTTSDISAIGFLESPLPGTRIKIRLEASSDLLGKDVTFRLGNESIKVPIEVVGEPFLVDLGFENMDYARELFIELPYGGGEANGKTGLNLTYLELSK